MKTFTVHALCVVLEPEAIILLPQLFMLLPYHQLVIAMLFSNFLGLLNYLLVDLELGLERYRLVLPLLRERLKLTESLQLQLAVFRILQLLGLVFALQLLHLAQQLFVLRIDTLI